MSVLNSAIKMYLRHRMERIRFSTEHAERVQKNTLRYLIHLAKNTEWGRTFHFDKIRTEEQYRQFVPLQTYDSIKPYIQRTYKGEQNVIWPTTIRWFSKSSGTTEDRSKFLPVSRQSLRNCHYRAGKDVAAMYLKEHPDTEIFGGKCLVLSGSVSPIEENPRAFAGDVSGVLIQNLDSWVHYFRTPARAISLIPEWEEKIGRIVEATRKENVTYISGVPSWMLVILNQLLETTGKTDVREVWPNLKLFIHGAVSFEPYKEQFLAKIPHADMAYYDTYNASEGFFALQDSLHAGDMRLMMDYGIYYEFLPMEEFGKDEPRTLRLEEVELDKNYALVISTNSGLWRYLIGDTVRFTSLKPYRIQITGRTKHFINAFGEELVVENAEKALSYACRMTGAAVREYTVAPVYISGNEAGTHEWLIEFNERPLNMEHFITVLDQKLMEVNSDYEAKRKGNLTLGRPLVRVLPDMTFYNWMKKRGRLGAQNKIPRLSNDRKYADDIIREAGLC